VAVDPFDYLFSLERFGIKFGLDNIRALVEALGHPNRAFPSLHVAGTNGKGSVAAMTEAALRTGGYRTGLYTSPHLADLAERFAIDGQPVVHGPLSDAIRAIEETADRLQRDGALTAPPTFFEATTAVAFELFKRAGVEVAICEVGLGGRLDATNVLEPVATAITSIGFDHQQYLGNSLREIAIEKAGIIKPRVPIVIGRMDGEARDAIREIARQSESPLIDAAVDDVELIRATGTPRFRYRSSERDYGDVEVGLRGLHQIDNARVAIRLLECASGRGLPLTPDDIVRGLARVSWRGRLEVRRFPDGREILLDAAHNVAGAEALVRFMEAEGWTGLPLILAVMGDKDVPTMLRLLLPRAESLVVTRASNARSVDPEVLADRARALNPAIPIVVARSPGEALSAAWRRSNRVVAAGSIFLLGDLMKDLDAA
jgi:dihydrofolate synthase/folylpolyglutamate synthase